MQAKARDVITLPLPLMVVQSELVGSCLEQGDLCQQIGVSL